MLKSPFDLPLEALPDTLPVFPLTGAVVLPRARLHLNVFEPRYLNLVTDALAARRLFGMIQPEAGSEGRDEPPLRRVGCAARIIQFEETDDGRFLIVLMGVCRYLAGAEVATTRGYRRLVVDYLPWRQDLGRQEVEGIARADFTLAVRGFLASRGLEADWKPLDRLPFASLVDYLAMHLPLGADDRQALLEAPDASERARMLIAITRIEEAAGSLQGGATRH